MSATSTPIACSSCGSSADLAATQAGGDRSSVGPLRVLIYCANCRAHPERCAQWREALLLAEVTEEKILDWFRRGETTSAPEIVSGIVFGEERVAFITEAKKAIHERR